MYNFGFIGILSHKSKGKCAFYDYMHSIRIDSTYFAKIIGFDELSELHIVFAVIVFLLVGRFSSVFRNLFFMKKNRQVIYGLVLPKSQGLPETVHGQDNAELAVKRWE